MAVRDIGFKFADLCKVRELLNLTYNNAKGLTAEASLLHYYLTYLSVESVEEDYTFQNFSRSILKLNKSERGTINVVLITIVNYFDVF